MEILMIQPQHKPRVVFLFSDTGGGHRSAAEAIIEAVNALYPNQAEMEMIDFFKKYAPTPLDKAPDIYPPLSKVPDIWAFYYHLSDGKHRTQALINSLWPYIRRSTRKLVKENPADLYVSVHPLVNKPILRAMGKKRPPFITVVTDMVSIHAFWYDQRSDETLVPTEIARKRGLSYGLSPEQIKVVGLPVAQRFSRLSTDKTVLREKLGWEKDRPVILLVGGGEGMGPLEQMAHAIDAAGFNASLVIIAGRNSRLKSKLEAHPWQIPVHVYGFVRDMPDFMGASDYLVTKAGPGTISEAFIAGLPIILYSKMPGQEDGNVYYVEDEGAGVWAPYPDRVVEALREYLTDPEKRQKAIDACHRLAKPEAASNIAREIGRIVGLIAVEQKD
jgi:1,2-diacylglycerol 3-beta-galactosyltransferase